MRYLTDRFLNAARLCTSEAAVKQRLANAWLSHLDGINADDLPEHAQREFQTLRDAMHAVEPQPNESPVMASVRKMSAVQAAECNALILRIALELLRAPLLQTGNQNITETLFERSAGNLRQLN